MTDSTETTDVLPDLIEAQTMMNSAIGQIRFARRYVLELLDATPKDLWFQIPNSHHTNVAWQVGHLTVSQYGLLMFRLRGRQPDDLDLIPGKFRKAYGRESVPSDDSKGQPEPDELLRRMAMVYERSLAELASVDPAVLLEPVDMPYAAYPCKLGAILFCPMHETLHAGQIGVIRRGLGLSSVR